MSYCRFSEDSDIYVYDNVNGYMTCCGCKLHNDKQIDGFSEFNTTSKQIMLEHIKSHIHKGHKVPKSALKRLKKEIDRGALQRQN